MRFAPDGDDASREPAATEKGNARRGLAAEVAEFRHVERIGVGRLQDFDVFDSANEERTADLPAVAVHDGTAHARHHYFRADEILVLVALRTLERAIDYLAAGYEWHVEEVRIVFVAEDVADGAAEHDGAVVFRTGEKLLGARLLHGRRDAVRDERAAVAPELGVIVDDTLKPVRRSQSQWLARMLALVAEVRGARRVIGVETVGVRPFEVDDPRRRLEARLVRSDPCGDVREPCAVRRPYGVSIVRRKGDGGEKRKKCRDSMSDFHNCRRLYHCPLFEVNHTPTFVGVAVWGEYGIIILTVNSQMTN